MILRRSLAIVAAIVVLSAACSDDGTGPAEPTTTTTEGTDPGPTTTTGEPDPAPTTTAPARPGPEALRTPTEVTDLGDSGAGIVQPLSNPPLPDGWTESEFAFEGEAVAFDAVGELGTDGMWDVEEGASAPYRSRLIVRRPPDDAFSGTVIVEWFNVTAGTDTSPDWGFLSEEIARSGHAYVGVSVQAVGVNGSPDPSRASDLVDTSGLETKDPVRYAGLTHPGDAHSFDLFTQAGAVVAGLAGTDVLGGLEPERILAIGESQSAIFMTTYVNAVHPLARLYDGFLIHSRGDGAPAPSATPGERLDGIRIRTDLSEPVFLYETETDLTRLGYAAARQDDTDTIRTWEVAGTAHADAYTLAASAGGVRDAALGTLIGCPAPINDGPQHETLQAALRHLVAWVAEGTPPPASPRIEVTGEGDDLAIVRDELGIAVGGIRTPPVDVPLRVLSGDPSVAEGGFCYLFGQTLPLDQTVLAERYPDAATYLAAFDASADEAIRSGWLLPEDAASMRAEEEARLATLGIG